MCVDPDANVEDLNPVQKHGTLQKIIDGVYYVEGTAVMGWVNFPRGMIVIAEDGQLSLINAIRLDAAGEAALLRLGSIASVVCLGCHDLDVAYYARRFGATVYAFQTRKMLHDVPSVDIRAGLPFGRATFIDFTRMPPRFAEACVLLHRDEGDVLIACDAVQDWQKPDTNWVGRLALPWYGFAGKCIFDRYLINILVKHMSIEDIKKDYAKLLDIDFKYLLSGHGFVIDGSAKEAMHKSFHAMFADVSDGE